MNYEVFTGSRLPVKSWTRGVQVEAAAKQQLLNLANMPFIHSHVAAMPDVHYGKGATIGSVIATKGAVIPAAVGVDIGCGMMAQRTSLIASDLPESLFDLRCLIEAAVPHGRSANGGANDKGARKRAPTLSIAQKDVMSQMGNVTRDHAWLNRAAERAHLQLGTLGTGNHFIELCLDEEQRVWVMLHSGSRGIGNAIGQHFIEAAKEDMRRWFINLPDADLAYLPEGSTIFTEYFSALQWAQSFAKINREIMMDLTLNVLASVTKDLKCDCQAINCHHNYASIERHYGENVILTRKGAVDAGVGVLGIIPGSMGAKSFIVKGKGNRESFCSCSHGAGRVMSRSAARASFTLEDHARDTLGVECRKDAEVIDETPKAYKDIEAVMAAQSDLVDIVHTLKQVLCVKG